MKQVILAGAPLRAALKGMLGKIAFVPTMGNLHAGHLTLVREAQKLAEHVVVSIFVNPMQFSSGEDIAAYPRTLQQDAELLAAEGVALLFTPAAELIYPGDMATHTQVQVPDISDLFCGVSRPGHFVGVATIVCKLFNMIQPDMAVFGKKDFQQLMVIRRMVQDLVMPVEVVGIDTVREQDGLAMSSRNGYLSSAERKTAPVLFASMSDVARLIQTGHQDFQQLEEKARSMINAAGLKTDYFKIRNAKDLTEPDVGKDLVILAAAYLGKARLIDNLEVFVN